MNTRPGMFKSWDEFLTWMTTMAIIAAVLYFGGHGIVALVKAVLR